LLIKKVDCLLEKEKGTIYKNPAAKIKICLAYPNTYHIGMSNLGFQGVYGLLNSRDDTLCERVFLPVDEDIKEYERTNSELFSYESKRPLKKFDIIAFSVSFENDYLSVVKMLRLAKISPLRKDRNDADPILLLGGICATANPEPLADIFDLIFIGEAEDGIDELIQTYKKAFTKQEFLKLISEYKSFYVPQFYKITYSDDGLIKERKLIYPYASEIIKKRTSSKIDSTIKQWIFTEKTEFSEMCLVEIMRGCPWKCRFCLTGYIYNPPRHKPIHLLSKEIESAPKEFKIGLIGPSITEYKHIKDTLKKKIDFSTTSLRASQKSMQILSLLKNRKSVSIAPEVGTERMRKIINKKITQEDILSTIENIFNTGIRNLKLYFMVGLPTETDQDIIGIINLVKKIRKISDKSTITLSVSTFVPKPFTPFQWHSMEKKEIVKKRLKYLKENLLKEKKVRLFHDVLKYSYLQGIFARGDRRLSNLLLNLSESSKWTQKIKELGLSTDFYIFRKRSYNEKLPWDFIDIGISKEELWQEYKKAFVHK